MTITIIDYSALYECLEKASYISDDVIIDIDKTKLNINVKNTLAKLSIESMCITADESCKIALADIKLFMVALANANESIRDSFGDKITVTVQPGKLLIKTNNSKTSIHQASLDIVRSHTPAIKDLPPTLLDFNFNSTAFKKINSALIFVSNTSDARVELGVFDDIQDKSLIGAKIFAANTPLSNYSIIDVGEINNIANSPLTYAITLDFDRINLLSKFSGGVSMSMSALEKPALLLNRSTNVNTNNIQSATTITLICSIVK